MVFYRFVPKSSQKGVLFFETPGRFSQLPFYRSNFLSAKLVNPKAELEKHWKAYKNKE